MAAKGTRSLADKAPARLGTGNLKGIPGKERHAMIRRTMLIVSALAASCTVAGMRARYHFPPNHDPLGSPTGAPDVTRPRDGA